MIEIQFQYRAFVQLKVKHNYYAKNLDRDIHFVPTAQSLALAREMGLLIKNSEGGISISYDVPNGDALWHYLKNNDHVEFNFLLISTNNSFINFTDMATESVGKIFHFNTLNAKKSQEGAYLLHQEKYVSTQDGISLKRGDFYYPIKSKKVRLELKNDEGKKIIEEEVVDRDNYLFQLSNLPQGRYTILEDGKERYQFAYVNQQIPRGAGVAMITVSINGNDKKDLMEQLERGEVLKSKEYLLHFDSRSTYWKYFIVSKYKLPLEKSGIQSENEDVTFNGPEKVKLPNGDMAYVFEASKPLPLNEIPKYNLKLSKNKKAGNGEAYLNRLPTPSPDSIKPESRDASAKVFSELIVYL